MCASPERKYTHYDYFELVESPVRIRTNGIRSTSGVDDPAHSLHLAAALIMSAPSIAHDGRQPNAVTRRHAVSVSHAKGLEWCVWSPADPRIVPLLATGPDRAPRAISTADTLAVPFVTS